MVCQNSSSVYLENPKDDNTRFMYTDMYTFPKRDKASLLYVVTHTVYLLPGSCPYDHQDVRGLFPKMIYRKLAL